MNTLVDEMEPFSLLLIVDVLELDNPLEEKPVGEPELLVGDLTLVHDADGNNELAVM